MIENKLKVLEYIDKYKDKIDKLFIITVCYLVKYTEFNYKDLKQLLKGAHFVIKNDNGFFYEKLKIYSNRRKDCLRYKSSHNSCQKIHRIGKYVIYDINGNTNKNYDCIIGKICPVKYRSISKDKHNHENCNSWFQFEKTRTDTNLNKLKHSFDYVKYIITKRNIGPFGYSKNTENNPIILNFHKKDNKN